MIGSLRGVVAQRFGDNLIVDVHGVGYQVTASSGVLDAAGPDGSEISVVVYTDVKETAITLYAFATQLEREVFLLLKKVKGIGSRTAMTILSGVGPEALLLAIGHGDAEALRRIPGVGKKTAERVLVELREYVGELAYGTGDEESAAAPRDKRRVSGPVAGADAASDAVLALEKLGFPGERAKAAVDSALAEIGDDTALRNDAGELLRLSLSKL